jgi:signal recognition particle subunit SEC65
MGVAVVQEGDFFAKLTQESSKDCSEPAAEEVWTEAQLNKRVRMELANQHNRLAIVYQGEQEEAVENAVEEMENKRLQEVHRLKNEHANAIIQIEDSQ